MTPAPKCNNNTHWALPDAHPRVLVCSTQPQVCHTRIRDIGILRSPDRPNPPWSSLVERAPGLASTSAVPQARGAFAYSARVRRASSGRRARRSIWLGVAARSSFPVLMPRPARRQRCVRRSDIGMGTSTSWTEILCEAHR